MATIGDMIDSFAKLGGLANDVARAAAPGVQDALRATAAAGQSPEGAAWAPKKDGGAPLQNAAEAISVKAVGPIVRATLTGPTVFHHFGGGRNPRRPVLPDPGTVPPAVDKAIKKAADEAFRKAAG